MLKGKKTYAGLVISLLGFLGVTSWFSPTETAQLADVIIQLVGLIFAAYGRASVEK